MISRSRASVALFFIVALVATGCVGPGGGGPANVAPTAVAAATPAAGQAPLVVALSSTGSVDSDGSIAGYSWNFGDGSPADVTASPSHTFAAAGTYTVTLTVTDNLGATGTATVTVAVSAANVSPVADATASPVTGQAPLVVIFGSAGSIDSDGSIAGYSWDFGDGSPFDTTPSPSHTYAAAGTYTATLTVTDNQGATGAASVTVTVAAADDPNGRYVATTGANTGTCTTSAAPCLTINYAVGQAIAGNTIYVAAGTYAESVLTAKSLNFSGANAGINAGVGAGVRGAESIVKSIQTTGTAFLNIVIDGFRIDPQGDAALGGTAPNATLVQLVGGTTGSTIKNNVIVGSSSYFPSCNAFGCATVGQQMAFGGILVRSGPTTISQNRLEKFRYGAKLTQNTALNPLVASVNDNVITQVTIQGIGIGGTTGQQQPGGSITNNQIDAVGRTAGTGGIVITNGGNTITNNTFTDLGSGVYLSACKKWDTRNITVDNNTFNLTGLVIATSFDGGQCITGSSGDTEGTGSWVVGGGHIDGFNANGNSFSGTNAGVSIDVTSRWSINQPVSAGPLDLTCNFWDSATGPTNAGNPLGTGRPLTVAASPTPSVTFSPWQTLSGGACDGS